MVEFRNVRKPNGELIDGYKYTYDAVGNIIGIYESELVGNNTARRQLAAYEYDAQNQLVSETIYTYDEDNETTTPNSTNVYSYTYDTAGNILTEAKNGTVTKNYTYSTGDWKDLLTNFNGWNIGYDSGGNPESYTNGKALYDFEWVNGRRLSSAVVDGADRYEVEYAYDADGIRTEKTVTPYLESAVTHSYITQNGKVVRETIGSGSTAKVLDFIYDESGRPFALVYTNGTTTPDTYYYVLNLQGDVVKLIAENGAEVAQYTYNAWGEIITSSGTMAATNPLRYRGYYYDTETGFYYLQSRYYDPVTHRFINADSYATTDSTDAISCNMFAYCGNNPVNRVDPTGEDWWHWVAVTVVVAALVVASIVTCGGAAAAAATAVAIATGTCAAASTTAVVLTGAAVGAGVAYAGAVVYAASESDSLDEFAEYGAYALDKTLQGAVGGAAIGYANTRAACFVAGTPVLTEKGAKEIEDIRAKDYVWAWDEETGDVALKRVVETYVNETSELIHVFVNGEEIITTPTHPFYCPIKGWTDAAQLRAGDILVLVNGEYVVVEKIQYELLESPVKVYNFHVEDYHTYYVASGVLVHNSCKPTRPGNMQEQVKRGQAPASVDCVHKAHVPGAPNQHPHVHFTDGTALNWDGSIHDQKGGTPNLTRAVIEWLRKNNWATEIKLK